MQINITPNIAQIRSYVQMALNAFETLEPEEARESNRDHLRALLNYLDALDHAEDVVVSGISRIEGGVRLELPVRNRPLSDRAQAELFKSYPRHDPDQATAARLTAEQDVGL